MRKLINQNVESYVSLPTPEEIKKTQPMSDEQVKQVLDYRQQIEAILDGKDDRLFVVVGPCSIHDTKQALDYAKKLKVLSEKVQDKILIIMRVYFEKPRTTVGWKGLINDPYLDDSFHIETGIKTARQLLLDLCNLGLAAGTEALDPIIPQYIGELISWTAIGARTTESQTHREMSSGLSTALGFKNGTDGSISVAINAMQSALNSHHFMGIDPKGSIAVFTTKGNPYTHLILRGGKKPNYSAESIAELEVALDKAQVAKRIVVDCSHGNSSKDHNKQAEVFQNVIAQRVAGNKNIMGLMLESHLKAGNQKLGNDKSQLEYGVSITDACIDFETTEKLLLDAASQLR